MTVVAKFESRPPPPPEVEVNWSGLIVGLLIVAFGLGMGVIWTRRRETRARGLIVLAFLLVPTLLSAVMVLARVLSR